MGLSHIFSTTVDKIVTKAQMLITQKQQFSLVGAWQHIKFIKNIQQQEDLPLINKVSHKIR